MSVVVDGLVVVWSAGVALPVVGLVGYWFAAASTRRRAEQLRRIPMRTAHQLHDAGQAGAAVAMEVRTPREEIRARLSGQPCGWFKVEVHQRTRVTDEMTETDSWIVMGERHIPMTDTTGTVLLTTGLAGSRLIGAGRPLLTPTVSRSSAGHTRSVGQVDREAWKLVEETMAGHGRVSSYPAPPENHVQEWIVPADVPVFVIGVPAPPADGLVVLDGQQLGWFGISIGGRDELLEQLRLRRIRWAGRARRLGAVGLAVAAAGMVGAVCVILLEGLRG